MSFNDFSPQKTIKNVLYAENSEDRIFIYQLHQDTEPELFGRAKLQSTQPFLLV